MYPGMTLIIGIIAYIANIGLCLMVAMYGSRRTVWHNKVAAARVELLHSDWSLVVALDQARELEHLVAAHTRERQTFEAKWNAWERSAKAQVYACTVHTGGERTPFRAPTPKPA